MDVPEMPLSKSLTGARNMTTPKALIMPAAVRNRKFMTFRVCRAAKRVALPFSQKDSSEVFSMDLLLCRMADMSNTIT